MLTKKNLVIGVILLIVLMHVFQIDKENPPVDPSIYLITVMEPPLEVANILKASCYDCHSHETEYPWYTNIAPFSWWIGHHIEEGREHLNFSEWANYEEKKALHKLEEMYEEVEEGEMPLESYLWIHSEAKLSKRQSAALINWVKSIPGVEDDH